LSGLLALAAGLLGGCFSSTAAIDLVRPSPPLRVEASSTIHGSSVEIEVTYEFLDGDDSFDLDVFFHPISTRSRLRLQLPEACPASTLAVLAEWKGETLQPFLGHRGALYWHFLQSQARGGSRLPPDTEGFECVLWFQRPDDPAPHGNVVISNHEGTILGVTPVPGEAPWLEPRRWAWLGVAAVLEIVLPFHLVRRFLIARAA
jgi:hypothetical protein